MGIWTELKAKFSGTDFKGPGLQVDADTAFVENDSGIMKSYIPNFLYKPPFGYPRPFNATLIRKLAKNGYVFSVVQTLADEIASKDWDIVVKEDHEGEVSDEELANIRKWFTNPNPENESFSQLLKKMVTDVLEVDAGVWVKVFNRGGEFVSIYSRDGTTFLANPDPFGSIARRSDYVPRNNLFYNTFNSLTNAGDKDSLDSKKFNSTFGEAAAWYQYGWTMGAYPVPFGKREIVYVMRNPRTDSLYGRAPLEVLGEVLYTLLYGSSYNLDFYLNNNMPEGIIQLVGANQETIKAFRERFERQFKKKDSFDNMRKQFFKYPVVNNDAKFTPFQLKPLEMEVIQQQEWFIKLFWACFGITADEMGFCYSEDTKVLTDNGLKYYWELNEEDKIATVLEDDKSIEYIRPTEIHTFDVEDRKFHHYKNNCIDTFVSDNHRMYYRTIKEENYRMLPSNEIRVDTIKFLQGGLKWIGDEIDTFSIPLVEYENNKDKKRNQQVNFSMEEFCEFMGYYLSEGSILKKMDEVFQYSIKVSQTKEDGIKLMNPLLSKMGFRRESDCWKLNSKSLARYLYQFGNSSQKFIPKNLKNLSVDKLTILFNALVAGDGYRAKEGTSIRYSTSSKQLAEDVLEIAIKIGYKASISSREFKNKNWNTAYTVAINDSQKEPRIVLSKQRKDILYSGVMWCPSVKNRPFITERNGKIGIHYNTQDSNKASATAQNVVVKRKVIAPMLKLIQYHINTQIIPEFGIEGVEFRFDEYDLEEDLKKHQLYQLQIGMGIKTPEMVAEDLGIDIEKLKAAKEEKHQEDMEMMQAKGPAAFGEEDPKENGKKEPNEKKPEVKGISRDPEAFDEIEEYIKEVGDKLIDAVDVEKRPLKKI